VPAPPRFTQHIPALAASAGGTLVLAVAASYLGPLGTVGGMVAGSMVSGTAAWWIERALRRSADLAKAKAKAVRARGGRPLTAHETQVITAIVHKRHRRRNWKPLAGIAAGALIIAAGTITMWEIAAGRPVAAIVTHRQGHGLTLRGGTTTAPQRATPSLPPTPTPTPSLTADAPSPAPVPTPTMAATGPVISPSAVPTATSAGPTTGPPATSQPGATPAGGLCLHAAGLRPARSSLPVHDREKADGQRRPVPQLWKCVVASAAAVMRKMKTAEELATMMIRLSMGSSRG